MSEEDWNDLVCRIAAKYEAKSAPGDLADPGDLLYIYVCNKPLYDHCFPPQARSNEWGKIPCESTESRFQSMLQLDGVETLSQHVLKF